MTPFSRSPGEFWLRFKIGDLLPQGDPLARDLIRPIAADEDLINIEHFKSILMIHESESKEDAISRTMWKKAQFFLLRLRFGFLSNVFDEVIFKNYRSSDRPSLESLIQNMPIEVQEAYLKLKEALKTGGRANEIIGKFRNLAAFHYSEHEFMKGLKICSDDIGEIIANQCDQNTRNLHFIVAHQIMEMIPAGTLPEGDVNRIHEAADRIQGLFHAFTVLLFDKYLLSKQLTEKISREEEESKNLVDRLCNFGLTIEDTKVTLASGIEIHNAVELIKKFYAQDGHILYDLLPVAEDNRLDPACLIAPAFFLSFNIRFDEWRDLWGKREPLEESLQRIPFELSLSEENLPWAPIQEFFERILEQKGFPLSRISKILHKKRPHLIPILDERIIKRHYYHVFEGWLGAINFGLARHGMPLKSSPRAFNDALNSAYFAIDLIKAIRKDILANLDLLEKIQLELGPYLNLSFVRIFDLILWEHAGEN